MLDVPHPLVDLFDLAPVACLYLDAGLQVQSVNTLARRLWGGRLVEGQALDLCRWGLAQSTIQSGLLAAAAGEVAELVVPDPASPAGRWQWRCGPARGGVVVYIGVWVDFPGLPGLTTRDTAGLEFRTLEGERRYQELFDQAQLGVLHTTPAGHLLAVNPELARLFGYASPADLLRQVREAGQLYADPQRRQAIVTELAVNPALTRFENLYRRKDGSTFWGQLTIAAVPGAGGHPQYYEGFVEDISERRQVEAALRESETRFRQFIEHAPAIIYQYGSRRGGLYYSPGVETILGYTAAELRADPTLWHLAIHPDDLPGVNAAIGAGGDFDLEYRVRIRSGAWRWMRDTCIQRRQLPDGEQVIDGIASDITGLKAAAESLRASEARYRLISENAADVIWILDPMQGRFKYVSPSVFRLRGYTPEEVMAQPVEAALTPESQRRVGEALAAILPVFVARGHGTESTLHEVDQPHKNGSIVHTEVTTTYLFNETGAVEIVGVSRDVTARKQVEAALRSSEERFRLLFETMTQGVVYHDAVGRIVWLNPAAERILAVRSAEVLGRTPGELPWQWWDADGRLLPEVAYPALAALQTGQAVHNQLLALTQGEQPDQTWITATAIPLFLPGQNHPYQAYLTVEDVTARHRNDELMRARVRLLELSRTQTMTELLQFILDEAGQLSHSPIGFYHFVEADQTTLTLQAWSSRTRAEYCHAEGEGQHYSLLQAGIWADSARLRQPLIHNDYAALAHRRGLPAGHAVLVREMVVPVMRADRVVAIMGVGNKPSCYSTVDLDQLAALADFSWDIVQRRRVEDDIRRSLQEKDTLLNELYHRTKNNMGVILSLLDLQAEDTPHPILQRALLTVRGRVRAMALVQEKLYESRNLSRIALHDFIGDLVHRLQTESELAVAHIQLTCELEPVEVLIDTAIPCGLVVHEWVTNAVRHAFPQQRPGSIRVSLRLLPDRWVELRVADDGVGLPPGFDFRQDGRVGVQTAVLLAERQLRGRLTLADAPGVVWGLQFPVDLYEARV